MSMVHVIQGFETIRDMDDVVLDLVTTEISLDQPGVGRVVLDQKDGSVMGVTHDAPGKNVPSIGLGLPLTRINFTP